MRPDHARARHLSLGILSLGAVYVLVQHNSVVGAMLGIGSVAVLVYVGWYLFTKCDKVERERTSWPWC